jgi:nicotinamidase/pyrazinamidase
MKLTEQDVLVVVDVQNDFCPGGELAVPGGDAIVPLVNRLGEAFAHVVLTQDWHPPAHQSFASGHAGQQPYDVIDVDYGPQVLWPDHCVQGSGGADFHPALDQKKAEVILRKGFRRDVDSYSALFENDHKTPTGLTGYLRERGFKRIFLAGLARDFCVHYSAIDAAAQGFDCVVIDDACRAIDLEGSLAAAKAREGDMGLRGMLSSDLL